MPTFLYRGYNAQGQKAGGSMSADNRAQAEQMLVWRDVSDYEIYNSETLYNDRPYALVKPRELRHFCREAAGTLDETGVSQVDKLESLAAWVRNPQLSLALNEMSVFVRRGQTLVGAISMYEHIFGALVTRLAATGEAQGGLGSVFTELADYYDREAFLNRRLHARVIFPAVWLGVTVAAALVMVLLFLPAARQGLLMIGFIAVCVLAYAVSGVLREPFWLDKIISTLPVMSRLTMTLYTGRLTRGLALLMTHDIPLSKAEACLRVMVNNRCVENKVLAIHSRTRAGQDPIMVLDSIKNFPPYFPPELYNEISMAVINGGLIDVMTETGRRYGAESERLIKRFGLILSAALALLTGIILTLLLFG